jgi:TonB family protein
MAPILKEADTSVSTATSAPAAPQPRPANETPTRPQPVALEIPVTVNGARTVDGSDKRVPFSESTQTVLVFPHGAVVRIATPLASGQLVFLTNEKTKKEVVCQIVKSKSTGSAAAYVELQFTEASAGFWGLQVPGGSAAPAAPRPAAPAPAAPKAVAPSVPSSAKPPVAAGPVPPAAIPAPPAKSIIPSAPPASHPAPVASHPQSIAPAISTPPAPPVVAPPPIAAAPPTIQQPAHVPPVVPADATTPTAAVPEQPITPPPAPHVPAAPLPPLQDYTKQIEALFTKPQGPAAPSIPDSHQMPPSPSTDELKQQAARLQAQLSSLLFTETHPASPAPPPVPATPKPQTPATEVANKVLEIAHEESKSAIPSEPKPAPPERKPASPVLAVDEEVKIPSWLAPLSQNTEVEVVSDASAKSDSSHDASISVNSEESFDALVPEAASRPETAVFGGQLLGESATPAAEASSFGSKKVLLIGIAASVLIAGGAWYFYQNHSASPTVATPRAANAAPAVAAAPAANSSPAMPAPNSATSSSAPAPQPAKKAAPAPLAASPVAEAQVRDSTPAAPEPVEKAPKPSLGDVHLAAPVVSHNSDSQADTAALPSIDTNTLPAGSDPLAAAAARHTPPSAPLPVGGDVKQARLIKSVPPEYPAIAKAQRVSGKVQIDALIDKSGNVANTKVLSGPPILYSAAVEAVKRWKYSPALLDGEPTPMHLTVTLEFRAH